MSALIPGPQTLGDLARLHLSEIVPHIHIIVGDGGKCLCGVYGDQQMTCVDILKQKSTEIRDAHIISELIGKTEGAYHMHPDGWWRLFPPALQRVIA